MFLRAYPCSQAFALPLSKDKQRKSAHAEWYYRYNLPLHLLIGATNHWDIIHPRRRSVALHLYLDSKLRSLTAQIVTFENVLSLWPALQMTSLALGFPQCLDITYPQRDLLCRGQRYEKNSKPPNDSEKKVYTYCQRIKDLSP